MKTNKYQKTIAIPIFFILFFSCQNTKQEDIIPAIPDVIKIVPTDCSEPSFVVQVVRSSFEGKIFNKSVTFKEFLPEDRGNIEIQQLPNFVEIYSWKNFFLKVGFFDRTSWKMTKLKIHAGIEGIDNQSIYITTPTIPINEKSDSGSYNNPQTLKNLFCRGQKELNQIQTNMDSLNGFVVTYNQSSPNSVENKYYSSIFGNQEGSILQVVDVKQFIPDPPLKATYGLQVKYQIHCKLYNEKGEYVGSIQNAELVTKYYYEPISQ
jgi:hypothetical protein